MILRAKDFELALQWLVDAGLVIKVYTNLFVSLRWRPRQLVASGCQSASRGIAT